MEGSFIRFRLESKHPPVSVTATGSKTKRRTKTGCLTCRTRRKKCDELKPSCVACRRNYFTCRWPDTNSIREEGSSPNASAEKRASWQLTQTSLNPSYILTSQPFGYKARDSYLLEHYVLVTSQQLTGREHKQNPFLELLMPLALQDSRVLEGVLAVSGAHLSFQDQRFESDARSHYAGTVRSVKYTLLAWGMLETHDMIALLTTTLLLGYFESIIGDTRGSVFHHLRASRTILLELQSRRIPDPSHLAFLTEWYAFTAITANVTLHTSFATMDRDIPTDNFLSADALQSLNKGTASYGVLFGAAHKLLALIVPIRDAARRLSHSPDLSAHQEQLHAFEAHIRASNTGVLRAHPTASEVGAAIYHQALLVYLHTTFHGTAPPTPALYATVDPCVDRLFELMRAMRSQSAVITTLMWPALVIGSCVRKEGQQARFSAYMEALPLRMGSCQRVQEVLRCMWEARREDERVYGPYGLEIVMGKMNVNLCVS